MILLVIKWVKIVFMTKTKKYTVGESWNIVHLDFASVFCEFISTLSASLSVDIILQFILLVFMFSTESPLNYHSVHKIEKPVRGQHKPGISDD